jgi:hypothetical protein
MSHAALTSITTSLRFHWNGEATLDWLRKSNRAGDGNSKSDGIRSDLRRSVFRLRVRARAHADRQIPSGNHKRNRRRRRRLASIRRQRSSVFDEGRNEAFAAVWISRACSLVSNPGFSTVTQNERSCGVTLAGHLERTVRIRHCRVRGIPLRHPCTRNRRVSWCQGRGQ